MTRAVKQARYSRQVLLPEWGEAGQSALGNSSVLLVGCGGLGSTVAQLLVRAGVGRLLLVDRDIVEIQNLHRQLLYDEEEAAACIPKAEAALHKLQRINSEVEIITRVLDVAPRNIEPLLEDVHLVVDGTDNVETRYLLNDACLEQAVPWVYGGAVGTTGMTMNFLPGGPCLRCVFPEPPPPGSLATCDTVGVLNTLPVLIGSLQASEALKILLQSPDVSRHLVVVDPWKGTHRHVEVTAAPDCPACSRGQRDFLDGSE